LNKKTKRRFRPYAPKRRGLVKDRIEETRTVERLPDLISAHADALVTIVGQNFGDHTSWGNSIRLALIIPPKLSEATQTNTVTRDDCLTWLEGFSHSLAIRLEERSAAELYRMVAVLEGSPNRGWFYTIILDLPKAVSYKRLKGIIDGSTPEPSWLISGTACNGVFEASHIIGRLGLAYLTEGLGA
jgi:hypothetical protein